MSGYILEKNAKIVQERFEQIIDILIIYKKENPEKDVYLTEKSMGEAIKWYQEKLFKIL
tara:strand:- start:24742 stop:24918 length:177 start_codon:yes stop_codon:yes gene_type:complete